MKLKTYQRTVEKKSDLTKGRLEGKIPAALYNRGNPSEPIFIEDAEFQAILRNIKKNRLSTTRIILVDDAGKERKVLIKDIQYHPTTYRVQHLDFEELLDDVKVKVNIPIEFTGVVDCVGIKLGGVLRQVIRNLRVQCLPKDMPEYFEMDVKSLALKQSKKLNQLQIPDEVRPLADLNEVCVVIAKR